MNIFQRLGDYFKGAIAEMKKVAWPTKQQTINYSLIVLIMSITVAVFFGVLDFAFNFGLEKLIK